MYCGLVAFAICLSMSLAVSSHSAHAAQDSIAIDSVASDGRAEQADLIVFGALTEQRLIMVRLDGSRIPLFALSVQRVVKGRAPNSRIIHLSMDNAPAPRHGQTGLWYLRVHSSGLSGLFVASQPDMIKPLAKAETFNEQQLSAR